MNPLFGPVPGGVELIVILIVMVMMFGLPLTIFGGLYLLYRRSKGDETREIAELRDEVAGLRQQIEEQGGVQGDARRDDGNRPDDRDDY